jgi:hypothetical protein
VRDEDCPWFAVKLAPVLDPAHGAGSGQSLALGISRRLSQMDAQPPGMSSAWQRLVWLLVPLLLLAAAANYGGLRRALRGGDGVDEPPSAPPRIRMAREIAIEIPENLGPLQAGVMFEGFVVQSAPCTCHVETVALAKAMAAFDPKRLRVEFVDLDEPAGKKRMKAIDSPVPALGFAINGKFRFRVPDRRAGHEGDRQVDFLAHERDWTVEDVYEAWAQEYRAAYGAAPFVAREAFIARASADVQRAREAATAPTAGAGVAGPPSGQR